MEVLTDYQPDLIKDKTAVALGMFDGVHLGHKEIINKALDYAAKNKIKSAIITLSNHPKQLTEGSAPKLITDIDSRLAIFEGMGIDYVLALEFNEELMNLSADDYLQKYLKETLNAAFISIGYDHHFGKGRSGTPEKLEEWCTQNNCDLNILQPFKLDGIRVGSSAIRESIQEGDIKGANHLLGHKYFIQGEVIQGDGRGKELGFPTANIKLTDNIVIAKPGVYHVEVKHKDDVFTALLNIGYRPTFKEEKELACEAHILDFNQDIYGEKLQVSFLDRIREECKFGSKEELIAQIKKDIDTVKCFMN